MEKAEYFSKSSGYLWFLVLGAKVRDGSGQMTLTAKSVKPATEQAANPLLASGTS